MKKNCFRVVFGLLCAAIGFDSMAGGADSVYDLRFGVISDTHIGSTQRGAEVYPTSRRLRKVLGWYNQQKNIDAIAIVGDITDNGSQAQWDTFNSVWNSCKGGLKLIAAMGNHDAYPNKSEDDYTAAERFEANTGQNVNAHYVFGSYHFIVINGGRQGSAKRMESGSPLTPGEKSNTKDENNFFYSGIKEWAIQQIEAAIEANPVLPVFLFMHHPIKNTFYVSDEWYTATFGAGAECIFNKYPQLVVFGGHIHSPNNDPRSIWQEGFTAVNTVTLHYMEMEYVYSSKDKKYLGDSPDGITTSAYPKHPVMRSDVYGAGGGANRYQSGPRAQGMVVSVKGSEVLIENFDFDVSAGHTNSVEKIAQTWKFDVSKPVDFPYTAAKRSKQMTAPVFSMDLDTGSVLGGIKLVESTENSVTIDFKQAVIPSPNLGGEVVHSYRFELYDILDGHRLAITRHQWSDFMNTPHLQQRRYTQILGGLKPHTKYVLRIYAYGSFQKCSRQYLTAEVSTE